MASNYIQLQSLSKPGSSQEPQQQQQQRQQQDQQECLRHLRRSVPGAYMVRPQLTERGEDGSVKFKILMYPKEALAAMNNFRQDGCLCDVTLLVKGEQIRAHKIVLAACSFYFRAMFTHGMKEASADSVEILEPNITAEALRTLVDFAYTNEIRVTHSNAQMLLVSSMFLEIRHVVEACTLFLEQQLDPSNCIGFAHFASIQGCLDLEAKAKKYIYDHFCEVIKYDEFLTLDAQDMVNIVQQDELNVRCETQVFRAVVRWVEHDADRRLCQLEDLLDKVRLSTLAPCFLADQLEKCHIIKKLPQCERLLLDRLRRLTQHRDCSDAPRRPCRPQVIYSVGGFHRKSMDSLRCFECYNPKSKEWTRLPDLLRPRCGPGVTSLHGLIYVVGGRVMKCGENFDSCSLDVYDPEENMWTTKSPMRVARNRVGIGVLDNMVYAVGGCSGGEQHDSVERYDPEADTWKFVSSMRSKRMSAGVAVLNRLLYAVGGFDGQRRLSSVECYHPENNEWQEIEPMNEPRSGAGVAVMGGCIYAVGGFDQDQNQLTTVERYDPRKRTWERVASLSKARSGVSVAVIDNKKLYALGGFDGSDLLACVESYDPATNTWECETNMLCARSGHGVTVEKTPNIT